MKGTDQFKNTIEEKLQEMAQQDQIFAEKFNNPSKNIDDCITYNLTGSRSWKYAYTAPRFNSESCQKQHSTNCRKDTI